MTTGNPARFLTLLAICLAPGAAAVGEAPFTDQQRSWWAYQPLAEVVPPDGGPHPIDGFIRARLAGAGLHASPPASAEEFIRRATFDLHGLPPDPEQIEAFAGAYQNDADSAVADLIDDLLASPRYGERWAQHWLDVARYAESDGYREDKFRPDAHRYRDYVVRSFNTDQPYDQFVREQLSADEFAAHDPATVEATGFLRLGIYEWNQRNAEMQRQIMVDEITNLTGDVFLGLGIGCAKCHDHKFDPLLQRDYFALQAFLSSTAWPTDRKLGSPEQLAAHRAWLEKSDAVREEMATLLAGPHRKAREKHVRTFPPNVQAMYWKSREERSSYEQQIAMLVQRQVDREEAKVDPAKALAKDGAKLARYRELEAQLAELKKSEPKLHQAFISVDTGSEPAASHIDHDPSKAAIEPAFPTVLEAGAPAITPREHSTGRRSALASWIASEDNPLTARVYVNRLWQHHFGSGLVATPNDFGTLGEPPSHPQLLDWLAARFLEGGWRSKTMHRLIMTSASYRQTARREPGAPEMRRDPGNRLLWRFPPQRLSAEQVRDAMLAVSGELRHRERGGASVAGDAPVRSIYVKRLRNTPDDLLQCFDAPAGFDSAPERARTTTPTQSLLLANNDWPMARARAFAKRVLGEDREVARTHIAQAYRVAWGRAPDERELDLGEEFIRSQRVEIAGTVPRPPPPKFPGETGLRPITQQFANINGFGLAERALWLQPGSRFEQLDLGAVEWRAASFTIEAVVQLDSIHKDASVNTLVSRWNGEPSSRGWAFGVTSEKSRYQPRNLILQLVGDKPGGELEYEVVASDLRVPLGKPVYLSATLQTRPEGKGFATFSLTILDSDGAAPQTAEVSHNISGGIHDPETRLLIGGREQRENAHLWDGQVARLTIGTSDERPFEAFAATVSPLLDAKFAAGDGVEPIPGSSWLKRPPPGAKQRDPALEAMADFCHALLSSNEFLYLH